MMSRSWIAVASAEHVQRGQEGGFMQVCHGKAVPLRRLQPGDRVVYYSPTRSFGGSERLQAFTALGQVRAGAPYLVDMGGGFHPYRRDVGWLPTRAVRVRSLRDRLAFTAAGSNWGYQLRLGLVEIGAQDMDVIAAAMLAPDLLMAA